MAQFVAGSGAGLLAGAICFHAFAKGIAPGIAGQMQHPIAAGHPAGPVSPLGGG